MKKLSVIIFPVLLLCMLAAGVAYGQIKVIAHGNIPFDFTVLEKSFPAGTYDVLNTNLISTAEFHIRGKENLESVHFTTIAREKSNPVDPKLVFRRYGNQYFLAELWLGGTTGRELPKSSKELQVAKSYGEPQLIYIAAK